MGVRNARACDVLIGRGTVKGGLYCLYATSIHANILAATSHLMHGSQMLEHLVQKGMLEIIGAEYSLEKGEVTFFD